MTALPAVTTTQKATLPAQIPAVLEALPPAAVSSTGAQNAWYYAGLFPPLDPDAPVGFVTSTSLAFVTVTDTAVDRSATTIQWSASSGNAEGSILGSTSSSAVYTLVVGADTDDDDQTQAANTETAGGDLALAATASEVSDHALDPSARFGFGDDRLLASFDDVVGLFNNSAITLRTALPDEPAGEDSHSWVFDEVEGAFVPHDAKRFTLRLDPAANPAPEAGHAGAPETHTAASVSEFSWFGTLRKFGSAAAARWLDV